MFADPRQDWVENGPFAQNESGLFRWIFSAAQMCCRELFGADDGQGGKETSKMGHIPGGDAGDANGMLKLQVISVNHQYSARGERPLKSA